MYYIHSIPNCVPFFTFLHAFEPHARLFVLDEHAYDPSARETAKHPRYAKYHNTHTLPNCRRRIFFLYVCKRCVCLFVLDEHTHTTHWLTKIACFGRGAATSRVCVRPRRTNTHTACPLADKYCLFWSHCSNTCVFVFDEQGMQHLTKLISCLVHHHFLRSYMRSDRASVCSSWTNTHTSPLPSTLLRTQGMRNLILFVLYS